MSARAGMIALACGWIGAAGILAWAPIGAYPATLATEVIILALWAVSYNLVYGYMGEISFGHAAYFGLGAFAVPIAARDLGAPFAVGIVGGVLVAAAFAGLTSLIIRRTRGVYYAVLTFALAEVVYVVAIKWTEFTGGDNGLPVSRPQALAAPENYAVFALAVVSVAMLALLRIVHSPAGRAVQAIRQNEQRARQIGYNTTAYRALTFTLSGAFSGLAGALYSPFIQFASPDLLFWTFSGQAIIMTIIGGAATFYGPILGAVLFVVVRDFVSSWSASKAVYAGVRLSTLGEHWPLFMGLMFFLIIVFEPAGLVGLFGRIRSRWAAKWRTRPAGGK
jgi:ABC-type branched-subunit amino acid transport system permease subunit